MHYISRWLVALGLTIAAVLLLPVRTAAQTAPRQDWELGDVFAGIGRLKVDAGKYLVFTPEGLQKPTVIDPFAGRTGITTGCMVAPNSVGGALFTTGYFNLGATRLAAEAGHAATRPMAVPSTVMTPVGPVTVESTESIIFDSQGNYYIGGNPPSRSSAAAPVPPYTFIFKFSRTHVLLATYVVPNGMRGANQVDLGSDERTLYYTSQDNKIRVFTPGIGPGDPDQFRVITITLGGVPLGVTAYGLRALPPIPGDMDRSPSGFLVATSVGVRRLDPNGEVLATYLAPSASSVSYFAIDITPDGQSFWTATFQTDISAPAAGDLVRFHISTTEVTAGPLPTGAHDVWGLCVKREYTAGINVCYASDSRGNAVLDPATGEPQTVPCRVPEICGNHLDDDGDGAIDGEDADCRTPNPVVPLEFANRAPNCSSGMPSQALWSPNHKFVPVTIQGISDPDGDPLSFSITGIQQDEAFDAKGSGSTAADGRIDGGTAWVRTERAGTGDGRMYQIFYSASDGKAGGLCNGSVLVGVAHSQSGLAVDTNARWNSLTGLRIR